MHSRSQSYGMRAGGAEVGAAAGLRMIDGAKFSTQEQKCYWKDKKSDKKTKIVGKILPKMGIGIAFFA